MRVKDENKIRAINKKAIEIIVKEGLDGLSMQKLAKAAKVSPATIYLYYKNREDFIIQLYQELGNKMTEAAIKGFDPDMHFAEGLKVQWMNRAKFSLKYPLETQCLEQLRHSPFHEKATQDGRRIFAGIMGQFVTNAIKRKELISFNSPEIFWSVAYAPLYQLLKFHQEKTVFFNKKFILNDEKLKQALALVVKGLSP